MSVEPRKPDPAILRKFELSKKEESLKQKLFQKKSTSGHSSSKGTPNASKPISPKDTTKRSDTRAQSTLSGSRRVEQTATNEMVGQFLKSMEKEFKDLNKKQVTMGMLNSQTQILKQHTEILNENQLNLANMVKDNSRKNSSKLSEESQKQLIKEIISPINSQILEIKKIYENTKDLAEGVASSVSNYRTMVGHNHMGSDPQALEASQRNVQDSFGDFKAMNSNLKDMVYHAQGSLSQVLPENLQVIKQISDLNVQAYSDCINTLKKQMQDLERDAEKAERELEARYKKLAQLPKPGSIKPNDPYYDLVVNGPETSEEVVKNIRSIDFHTSRSIVLNRLGGEFDYEQFRHETSELANEMYEIRNRALEELEAHQIDIPSQIELLEYDRHIIDSAPKGASILDELKAKYSVPKQVVLPKPAAGPSMIDLRAGGPITSNAGENQSQGEQYRPKKKSLRPKEFDYIKTVPQEAPPDVQFMRFEVPREEPKPRENLKKKADVKIPESTKRPQEVMREPSESSDHKEETIDVPSRPPPRNYEDNQRVEPGQRSKKEVRFNLENEDHKEEDRRQEPRDQSKDDSRVQISMDRYDIRMTSQNNMQPRAMNDLSFDQVKSSDAGFNRLFEGLILQDLKEHIMFSDADNKNIKNQLKDPKEARTVYQQSALSRPIQGNSQLYYPQMMDSQLPSYQPEAIDDRLLQQLALETLSEKLLPNLISEAQKERSQTNSLFEPVQSKPVPELQQPADSSQNAQNLQNMQATQQMAGLLNLNGTQLPTMIAENILNLFNAAMMQINTSLTKNIGQSNYVDTLNQKNLSNIDKAVSAFAKRDEPNISVIPGTQNTQSTREAPQQSSPKSKTDHTKPNFFSRLRKEEQKSEVEQGFSPRDARRDQVHIAEEKPLKPKFESKKPTGLLEALYQEQRNIQEEQDILKQRKHFITPAQTPSNTYGLPMGQGYYFANHEPQPISNLAEYYKELHSENLSSSDGQSRPTLSHRGDRRGWGTPSVHENEMFSEGQVFPNEGSVASEHVDVPNFNRTLGAESDLSRGEQRFSSTQKAVIADNLFKGLHEDDREPGEVDIFNIFKA